MPQTTYSVRITMPIPVGVIASIWEWVGVQNQNKQLLSVGWLKGQHVESQLELSTHNNVMMNSLVQFLLAIESSEDLRMYVSRQIRT